MQLDSESLSSEETQIDALGHSAEKRSPVAWQPGLFYAAGPSLAFNFLVALI
jgi:hypothetical protein